MSKARSPREVCSTTIGTSGLMLGTLPKATGGPAPPVGEPGVQSDPAASRSFSGVQIFSRASACSAGSASRPRRRCRSPFGAEVFADHRVAAFLRRRARFSGVVRSCSAGWARASSSSSSVASIPRHRRSRRGRPRAAAPGPRLLRFLNDLLGLLRLHLKVIRRHAAGGDCGSPSPTVSRRDRDELIGEVDPACSARRRSRRPEVLLDPPVDDLGQFLADVRAQLLEGVELRRLGGELVIGSGRLLPDLLDVDPTPGPPASCSAW